MTAQSKTWKIKLRKISPIVLTKESVFQQIHNIAKIVKSPGLKQAKLDYKIPQIVKSTDILEPTKLKENEYLYEFTLLIRKQRIHKIEAAERQFEKAIDLIRAKASIIGGWSIQDLSVSNGKTAKVPSAPGKETGFEITQELEKCKIPDLTSEVFSGFFSRIYDREDHIKIIHASAKTAEQTLYEKRRHILLYGQPACAKSEIFEAFKSWLNSVSETELVFSLDATTTTKAGLEIQLLQRAEEGTLPPFLLLEEIEKHDPTTLLCLLGVMDQRGRIQRTNARIGNKTAAAKIVVWATCNDEKKLKNFEGGALFSRFAHKLYCTRPSEILMKRILEREANEMQIPVEKKEYVINRVMQFGLGIETNDPREFVSFLDGWRNIDNYIQSYIEIITKAQIEISQK